MATFGCTAIGLWPALEPSYRIVGSVFTCPEPGTLTKVTAYLAGTAFPGAEKARAAVYRHTDLALVAQSGEVDLPAAGSPAWIDFALSGAVVAAEYILVVHATANYGFSDFWAEPGGAEQGHHQSRAYSQGFPDPLSPTHVGLCYSIYATYTPGGGGPVGYYYRYLTSLWGEG